MPSSPEAELLPLSAAQQSVWFAQQLIPQTPIYIAQYMELEGPFELDLFNQALLLGADESEVLHFRLIERDGIPYQSIEFAPLAPLELIDFSAEADPAGAARAWIDTDLTTPV